MKLKKTNCSWIVVLIDFFQLCSAFSNFNLLDIKLNNFLIFPTALCNLILKNFKLYYLFYAYFMPHIIW